MHRESRCQELNGGANQDLRYDAEEEARDAEQVHKLDLVFLLMA